MRHLLRRVVLVAMLAAPVVGAVEAALRATPARQPGQSVDALLTEAFEHAYNLDHEEAVALARRAVAVAPDNPRSHRALASLIWLKLLFHRGTVTIDHFMGGVSKSQLTLPKPPADLDAEFKRETARAVELAEARLARNPTDLQARLDVSSAYALQASYTASIEGSMSAAFRSAKRAFDAGEYVLERDPKRVGAGVVVGTYRYLVSALNLPARMFAYVVGFGGGKERGISQIQTALGDGEVRVEASLALLLIFSREGRHNDALAVTRQLGKQYPRNRLFVLEEGATAIRAGKAAEADAALTRGLAAFDQDPRLKIPGERALWLYKRGLARLNMNRPAEARADLAAALGSEPVQWVRGRIHLELGKLADLAGRRADALGEYRTAKAIADGTNDPVSSAEATRWLKRPFSMTGRTP